jgi:hypothetical protein
MNNRFKMAVVTQQRQIRGVHSALPFFKQMLLIVGLVIVSTSAAADNQKSEHLPSELAANQLVVFPDVLTDQHQTHAHPQKPFVVYQPQDIQMPKLHNWVESNARVQAIGGWMFYASEGDDESATHSHTQHQPKLKPSATPVKERP